MSTESQIEAYLASQPAPKQSDMRSLHGQILEMQLGCRLWFNDGLNAEGKVVANPNIGYGVYTIHYADNSTKQFYRIGLSANSTGISVYVLGLEDKNYLADTYGRMIGKASVTGYCIKFKAVKDIEVDVLLAAIRHGFDAG